MSLNWKEIDRVLAEFNFEGAQIQKIIQTSWDVLSMVIYSHGQTHSLLIALAPGACRMHETFRKVPGSDKPLRFAEILKARIKGGRILDIQQLGQNRIVRMRIQRADEEFRLYIRLWANAANLILCNADGHILDALKRSPRRGEMSGGSYSPETDEDLQKPSSKEFIAREFEGELSYNEKVDTYYANEGGALSLAALREQALISFERRQMRLDSALRKLQEKEKDYENHEQLTEYGNLILSAEHWPEHPSEWLHTTSWTKDQAISIRLKEKLSRAENAAWYFELARKAKSGLSELKEEIEKTLADIEQLEHAKQAALSEENPLKLMKYIRAMNKPAQQLTKNRPGLSYEKNGWLIMLGRNNSENDELLRKHAKGLDLWLHVRDGAGSHVFIRARKNKTVPLEILLDAANLALYWSKLRKQGSAEVYYTHVKYLRRAKGAKRGTVLPSQDKNLSVSLDERRLKALEPFRTDIMVV